MRNKVGILNLGCPRNLVDAENFLGQLDLKGYTIVDIDKADIGIINTCAFIEDAKMESIEAILELADLKRQGRIKKIIVAGCLPQRYKVKLLKELPEVDCFMGSPSLNHNTHRFALTPKHYAYLKICEGCLNNCSYCVIPKIKGKFRSLPLDAVREKVKVLDKEKISELNIIGQDITGYGLDLYGQKILPELLGRIVKEIKHIRWIRLLYLYPQATLEPLLDLIKDEPKICKYIDLPIQHINERILKLMHRHTTKKQILTLIDKIRKKIPDAAIRTSVIVGFPSETDKEFLELLKFIQEVKFERLGAFIYSPEEDTPAYNYKKQIPRSIKIKRLDAVMSCQKDVSYENNKKLQGRIIEVLIDEKGEGYYLGRSQYDAPEVDGLVYVKSKRELNLGDLVLVRITDTLEYDLVGEVVI
jgi:ribosomal protein S12 methylthiotransferase